MYGASLKEQLQQFSKAMQKATGSALSLKSPANWVEAFHALEQYLAGKTKGKNGWYSLMNFPGSMAANQDFFLLLNISGIVGPADNPIW